MCDAMSFSSAFADVGGGIAAQIDHNSRGALERAQFNAAAVLAQAEARGEETALRKSFQEQFGQNLAAAAISGLDPESFASITKGNDTNLRDNIEILKGNADAKSADLKLRGAMAEFSARMEGKAALMSGIVSAAGTLAKAEHAYQENHLAKGGKKESRWDYAKRSSGDSKIVNFGSSFFKKIGGN